jgi:hypothetical protein
MKFKDGYLRGELFLFILAKIFFNQLRDCVYCFILVIAIDQQLEFAAR